MRAPRDLDRVHRYLAEQDTQIAKDRAKLAFRILDDIIAYIKPGIKESEVSAFADTCFANYEIDRKWHPSYIRFGSNTLLTFRDKAREDRTLGEEDIAYVDIGIVKDGVEGDAGRSVAFGDSPILHHIAAASETIFNKAREFWLREQPRGQDLYAHIHRVAEELDVIFNLDPAGHLIGAYPHTGWKKGINNFPEHIEAGKWILEIQIRHKTLPIGSFYENLLH